MILELILMSVFGSKKGKKDAPKKGKDKKPGKTPPQKPAKDADKGKRGNGR